MGADTVEEAITLYETSNSIMKDAGMNLRKWASNDKRVQHIMNEAEADAVPADTNLKLSRISKVLGMIWDKDSDSFKFSKLWKLGVNWDEEIPEELYVEWSNCCRDIPNIYAVHVPRHIKNGQKTPFKEVQLHIFVDASTQAYGACAYLRIEDNSGDVGTTLVTAKARVAPLKVLSLPRLELMGATIGTRLLEYLGCTYTELKETYTMWTDSTVVLSWIRGPASRWKPFVKHRVLEIQTKSVPEKWRHCPGDTNPADLLTRGESPSILRDSCLWWKGPKWLISGADDWPETPPQLGEFNELETNELKPTQVYLQTDGQETAALFDLKKCNGYQKVLRITAWVTRFARNSSSKENRQVGQLEAVEYAAAEQYWIKQAQGQAFSREIQLLSSNQDIEPASPLSDLHPFLDHDNTLKVTGRLQQFNAPCSVTQPIILPNDHHLTELIIMDAHYQVGHEGVSSTMATLRQRFWIPRARQRNE
ncbi:uncharacterized protein LOC115312149 [Ixodes scapularis]|uniref:uncharacterized protein LOC115312149 n=1 Tax=Ixodes scapularis TaxID=6945 RepID=UPI001C3931EE|nr:uncharacterized protein LOC115312149 [Ixodes scapularis]